MARGIGGDDGPSLWMFVAVVLAWGAFKTWFSETKSAVSETLGIGQNTAGPFQNQSTKDISNMERQIKGWHVAWSQLSRPKTFYQNIADAMWQEMLSSVNIDEAALIAFCKPLRRNELMAVAVCFGVKEAEMFGLTTWSGHIFHAMDMAFEGIFKKGELAEMKRIWAPTKLW